MRLLIILLLIVVCTTAGTHYAAEHPVFWIQTGWLLIMYVLGRGAPDLTMMTSESWGGFWGMATSPLVAFSVIVAGFADGPDPSFYFTSAIAHILGWLTIRLIWKIFFRG